MHTDFLITVFRENHEKDAILWGNRAYTFNWLLENISKWEKTLLKENIIKGAIVALEADFSPNSVALLIALINHNNIIIPLTDSLGEKKIEFREIGNAEYSIVLDPESDNAFFSKISESTNHALTDKLKRDGIPGLIVFSSGSTGASKATVHDFSKLLDKFRVRRPCRRTLAFLLFDHLGGINTILHILSNGGCVITTNSRRPDDVCKIIQDHKVQILPTSPTFINLIILSEAYKRYDLSCLEKVTYGTEPMTESTLRKFSSLFPGISLQQTYGLSEIGVLRTRSKSSESLWVKVGGEGFETRIIDGLLEIKSKSAMLGYLNAPSPFTEDGWFMTNDAVEINGEYIKILGRQSEMINVGGAKVYPAEVESVIQEIDGVEDVTVCGIKNSITGQIVSAAIKLETKEKLSDFKKRMRTYCKGKLESYKTPQKITLVNHDLYSRRVKKQRSSESI
jgi:long-chain acyl-CoA synthetase